MACNLVTILTNVVYFDQLLGAAGTLRIPESWWKYFFGDVFNFFSYSEVFSQFSPENVKKHLKTTKRNCVFSHKANTPLLACPILFLLFITLVLNTPLITSTLCITLPVFLYTRVWVSVSSATKSCTGHTDCIQLTKPVVSIRLFLSHFVHFCTNEYVMTGLTILYVTS